MDDIARLAGVSKPTVSRALHGSAPVNSETRKRVLAVAHRYGYAVNRNAQKLRSQRSDTVGVVIDFPSLPEHRISDPFHFELLANVANALAIRNQDVLLCSPRAGGDVETYQNILTSKGADGFIFLGQGGRQAILKDMAKNRAPFVVWGAVVEGMSYCVVGSDNFRGGVLVGKRFAQLGRRRVLFLGPQHHPEIDTRRAGLAEGVAGNVEIVDLPLDDLAYNTSFTATKKLFASSRMPPAAVFGASDTIAIAAIAAVRELGLRVPEDCSVIGYDDSPYAQYHVPPLTTVRQDTRLAGALLVEKLIELRDGARPESVLLPTELVIRGT